MDDVDDDDNLLDAAIRLSIQESCNDIASLGRCHDYIFAVYCYMFPICKQTNEKMLPILPIMMMLLVLSCE